MVCFAERPSLDQQQLTRLQGGEVLVNSQLYSLWGGAVTVQIYLPLSRSLLWETLTDYNRWPDLFSNVTHSCLLKEISPFRKRVYQGAKKQFAVLNISVEAELTVREYPPYRIWFLLEEQNQSFREFEAEVWLIETEQPQGTVLTYTVQAAATLPIPSPFIQDAMRHDLPENLLHLRQYLFSHSDSRSAL